MAQVSKPAMHPHDTYVEKFTASADTDLSIYGLSINTSDAAGGGDTWSLPNGSYNGQRKAFFNDDDDVWTITPSTQMGDPTTFSVPANGGRVAYWYDNGTDVGWFAGGEGS